MTTKPLIALVLLASLQPLTLRTALALQSKDVSPQSQEPIQKKPQIGSGIQLLSDTQGVDFNSYLQTMYLSVKYKWQSVLPPSVGSGEQGRNTVQFRVLQDGTVPEEFLKLVFSSEKKDLDEASMQAIRKAAPFSHLPEKYSAPFIILRFTFAYNTALEKR
jgi:TonB family protein